MGKKFGDIPRGIFIVRGENVVLLGEIVSLGHWFVYKISLAKDLFHVMLAGQNTGSPVISHKIQVIIKRPV